MNTDILLRLYNIVPKSALQLGSEAWILRKEDKRLLDLSDRSRGQSKGQIVKWGNEEQVKGHKYCEECTEFSVKLGTARRLDGGKQIP
jgi:hypothetical protein